MSIPFGTEGQSETQKKQEEGLERKSKYKYRVEVNFAGHCDYYYTSKKPYWHFDGPAIVYIIKDFYYPFDGYGDRGIYDSEVEIFQGSAMITVWENPLFKEEEPSIPVKEVE